jgi:phosphatidylserine decarboxylase
VSLATFAAAQIVRALPRVRLSRAIGRLCDSPLPAPLSRALASAYCRAYRVDLADVAPCDGPYPTFDAFFTRPLRAGARAISTDDLVCPADGKLSALGPIDPGAQLLVKGRPYDVVDLTGDPDDARRYAGGSFAIIYLSPRDYHRVHAPVDGVIPVIRGMSGDLFPVNPIGERHVPKLLVKNQRVAICIDSERSGRVSAVMVGAIVVGRISVSALDAPDVPEGTHLLSPPLKVKRGDEIGVFHLGSTVVLLLEPGVTLGRREGPVRYGESLTRPA